jgi:hypothetical protein
LIAQVQSLQIEEALGKNVAVAKAVNVRHDWTQYDKLRCMSVLRFLEMVRKGEQQVQASIRISEVLFGGGKYRAAAIRSWASAFRVSGALPLYEQGKHPKRASLIDEEEVQRDCIAFLRSQKDDERTALSFCRWFSDVYFVLRYGMRRAKDLSENTARTWFKKLGWYMWGKKKGLYVDGHEREDVVNYRKIFATRCNSQISSAHGDLQRTGDGDRYTTCTCCW